MLSLFALLVSTPWDVGLAVRRTGGVCGRWEAGNSKRERERARFVLVHRERVSHHVLRVPSESEGHGNTHTVIPLPRRKKKVMILARLFCRQGVNGSFGGPDAMLRGLPCVCVCAQVAVGRASRRAMCCCSVAPRPCVSVSP